MKSRCFPVRKYSGSFSEDFKRFDRLLESGICFCTPSLTREEFVCPTSTSTSFSTLTVWYLLRRPVDGERGYHVCARSSFYANATANRPMVRPCVICKWCDFHFFFRGVLIWFLGVSGLAITDKTMCPAFLPPYFYWVNFFWRLSTIQWKLPPSAKATCFNDRTT